jgi:hypothetical protein
MWAEADTQALLNEEPALYESAAAAVNRNVRRALPVFV